jgi:hypothetical protein
MNEVPPGRPAAIALTVRSSTEVFQSPSPPKP